MIIAFMGMKHCGKSTTLSAFSRLNVLPAYDLDREIETLHNSKTGSTATVRELFRERGVDYFRMLEAEASRLVTDRFRKSGTIEVAVALGGGTVENAEAMASWMKAAFLVYLREKESVLFERIELSGIPPFLEGDDPRAVFGELYRKRTAMYERIASKIIDVTDLDQETIARLATEAAQKAGML
jgi:shikimate kinase